ncbi:MAG: MFS transporter [Myxococcales bacterium]|nr:MFS transporter [Myxococcales bacterium]
MNPWRGLAGLPRASYLIALATFINRAGVMVRPFLVVYLVQHVGLSEGYAAWMLSLYGATAIASATLSGWLADRFGAARVLRSSLVVAAAAILLFPLAGTELTVALCTVVFALFNEMPRPALMTLVADVAPPELRKQAFVLSRVAVNLGLAIGPALGGFIAEFSYVAIFWVDAAASLAAACLLMRTHLPVAPHATRPEGSAVTVLLRDRALLLFFAATVLSAVVFFQHDSTLAYWMTEVLGQRKFEYGLTITLNTLLIVFIEVELNTRLAHWSHRRSLVFGGVLTALGFGAMAFASGFWSICATVVIWTFGEMIAMPAMSAFVADLAPTNRRGLYMSTLMLAFGSGLTIGPKLGMTLFLAHGAVVLWLAVGVVGLLSVALYSLMPSRSPKPADAVGEGAGGAAEVDVGVSG